MGAHETRQSELMRTGDIVRARQCDAVGECDKLRWREALIDEDNVRQPV